MKLTEAEIERLAASLRCIDTRGAARLPNEHRLWLQGNESYFDVFVDLDDRAQPTWFQFTLRGQVYTWDARTNDVWTGDTNELGAQPMQPGVKLITRQSNIDPNWRDAVRRILQASHQHPVLQTVLAQLP